MILQNWKMSYREYIDLDCTAPCSMYSVLYENGLINDPFYGLNELEYTGLSDSDCCFYTEFDADAEMLSHKYIEIIFYGLDTLCNIYINNKLLDKTKNMHRTYVYDIKQYLSCGVNTVKLEFKSPTNYFRTENNKHYLYTNGDSVQGAAHLRKALYMSGWDWGPKLPDMGIFRPVTLRVYDYDYINHVFVSQNHFDNRVELEISVETKRNTDCEIWICIDNKRVRAENNKATVLIENPKLWWVRGYGEQPLYELIVELHHDFEIIDTDKRKIGLRTIDVSTAKDELGSEFCFVINGVKIFAMGANYVPQDNLISRITPSTTYKLLNACLDANYNCIRVWGGGYYPEDEFYNFCDEHGILVWQDFMVACMNIWLTNEMRNELICEITDNLKRLRSHPSLGLLCGNNEMETAILEWPGVGDSMLVKNDYLECYERLIPELCRQYAPQTFYLPSSPSSGGGFDDPSNILRGDSHYWDVWHGNAPFTDYRKHKFRFCSEYGFESYPSIKTIDSFCEKSARNCFSRVMENHQKCKSGNTKILTYIADNYLYPTSFENLVYASQVLQAEAIKYGVEYFRRIRGICMGSIYWQVNDCWPVASWSSIDYFGRYKALHYAAKKFYSPIAMGLFMENDKLTINISNETLIKFEGKVCFKLSNANFEILDSQSLEISVDRLSSKDVLTIAPAPDDIYSDYIYADLYDNEGNIIMRQCELFVKPKHYSWRKPSFITKFEKTANGVNLLITSDVFAKNVYIDFKNIDCILSDNCFDLVDGKAKKLFMETSHSVETLEQQIIIKSVYDIGAD